jgi:hypothetical protein
LFRQSKLYFVVSYLVYAFSFLFLTLLTYILPSATFPSKWVRAFFNLLDTDILAGRQLSARPVAVVTAQITGIGDIDFDTIVVGFIGNMRALHN